MRWLLFSFIFLSSTSLFADTYPNTSIVVITIPKSGTHMLSNIITKLTERRYASSWPIQRKFPWEECWDLPLSKLDPLTDPTNRFFVLTHLMFQDDYQAMLVSKQCKVFFMYRDPRDQIISAYFYLKNHPKWPPHSFSEEMETFIFEMIDQKEIADPYHKTKGVLDFYSHYLPWMDLPGIFCVRFEDLVGSAGGGSDEKRKAALKGIRDHLGVSMSDEQLFAAADALDGRSITFRAGKINSWREFFNEEHKRAFKRAAGQLLITLGYETDFDW